MPGRTWGDRQQHLARLILAGTPITHEECDCHRTRMEVNAWQAGLITQKRDGLPPIYLPTPYSILWAKAVQAEEPAPARRADLLRARMDDHTPAGGTKI